MAMVTKLRGLYAITPESADGRQLLADVEAALTGGCRLVQFRDKLSDAPERVRRARALREVTRHFGARLIINDDLALATLIDADGVHLGKDDGNLVLTRAILGPDKILGASCYADFSAAQLAAAAGADYIAFGAVYPSPTKPAAATATVDLFFQAKTTLTAADKPYPRATASCAIGGITLANSPPLIAAGADLLAVITDLFSASGDSAKITARTAAYQRLFEEAHA